ncbi:MAG TPA: ABC transporter permease, partial [Vicinamibacterales bacterium]
GGLSLGLGIATAAFSVMNAAVLRGEGIVDSDRVPAVVRTDGQSRSTAWTYDEFVHLHDGSTLMQVEAALRDAAGVVTTSVPAAEAETDIPSAAVAFVSGGFFSATGGRMTLGRTLEPGDDRHAGPPPVVVSFVFWKSRLGGDPDVVGHTIRVGRTGATIVGVAERRFTAPSNRLLWMPLTSYGAVYDDAPVARTPGMAVEVFGRLLPRVSPAAAEAQVSAVAAALPRKTSANPPSRRVELDARVGLGRDPSPMTFAITVFVFAVIGLVLLLAAANVASVLISTAITREREMGVRAALGASRWRIVRQLVTESLLLGAVAAAVALVFAYWTIPVIGRMIEAPAGADLAPDPRVYLFLGTITILSSVGAGLAPAWHGRGADLVTPLKGEGANQGRSAPRRLRSLLVMTQAAGAVILIVVATLFVRATFHTAAIDLGFDRAALYVVSPGLGRAAFENDGAGIRSFWARAVPDVTSVPGVTAATLVEVTPFGDLTKTSVTRDQPARRINLNRTRAEYFEALGLRVLAGRTYTTKWQRESRLPWSASHLPERTGHSRPPSDRCCPTPSRSRPRDRS